MDRIQKFLWSLSPPVFHSVERRKRKPRRAVWKLPAPSVRNGFRTELPDGTPDGTHDEIPVRRWEFRWVQPNRTVKPSSAGGKTGKQRESRELIRDRGDVLSEKTRADLAHRKRRTRSQESATSQEPRQQASRCLMERKPKAFLSETLDVGFGRKASVSKLLLYIDCSYAHHSMFLFLHRAVLRRFPVRIVGACVLSPYLQLELDEPCPK